MPLLDRFKHLFGSGETPYTKPTHTSQATPDRPLKRIEHSRFICAVVGESHRNKDGKSRQTIIKKMVNAGDHVSLRREPDNPHDPNAVAVFVHGEQIGYLKREVAERLSALIDIPGYAAEAVVDGVYGGTPSKPSLGITLEMTVYQMESSDT